MSFRTRRRDPCRGKFQSVFPEAPESFDQTILRALHEGRGARPERYVGRRLLIAACLLLILSAACYAVVKGIGVLDLLRDRGGVQPREGAAGLVQPLPEQTGGQFDGVRLTVEEALTDGRQIYFTARFAPEVSGGALLLGDWDSATGQAEEGGKTFAQLAKETGAPLLRAEITAIQIDGADAEDIEAVDTVRDGNAPRLRLPRAVQQGRRRAAQADAFRRADRCAEPERGSNAAAGTDRPCPRHQAARPPTSGTSRWY